MTARRPSANLTTSDTNSTARSYGERRCDRQSRSNPRRADSFDVRKLPSAEVRRDPAVQRSLSPAKRRRSHPRRHTNLPELITSSRGASSYSSEAEVKYSLDRSDGSRPAIHSCQSCGRSTLERMPTTVPTVSRSQNFLKGLAISQEEKETGEKMAVDGDRTATLDTVASGQKSDEVYRLPIFRLVDFGLRKVLWKMSALLVRSPTLLIVIPLVLAAISSVGLILRREELSLQMPFTSYFSPSESSGHVAELHFNSSQPRYDAINRLSGTDFAVLIETKGDDNILREELIDNYLQLKKRIESIRVRQGDNSFDFASLCRRTDGSCEINVVEKLLARKIGVQLRYPEIQPADYHNQHQQSGIPNGTKLFLGTTFGGVEKDPEGNMAGAKSLAMYFKLGTAETEELARRKWQVEFDAVAASAAAGINATVQFWSFATFSSEVIRQFEEIRNCLAGSLAILVVSVLLLHSATSCYTSRPWLGLAGVVATLTSFMSAMGIVVGAEGRLEPDISSFLLFSAGSASFLLFDLLKSWRKFGNIAVDPGEKIRFLCGCEIPGPILICFIGALAIGATGLATNIPLLRQVCSLTAAFLPLMAVGTVLLYGSAVFLTGRREAAGLKWYRCCSEGDTNFPSKVLHSSYLYREMRKLQKRLYNDRRSWDKSFGRALASPTARYAALLVFIIFLIFTIYGCVGCRSGLDELNYLPNGSQPYKFLNNYRQLYGPFDRYVELLFDDSISFNDFRTINSVASMLEEAKTGGCVEKVISWLIDYLWWAKKNDYNLNPENFVTFLQHEFLKRPENHKFQSDLIFGTYRSNAVISGSRMYLEMSEKKCSDPVPLLRSLSAMAKSYGIPVILKSPSLFLLRHDLEVHSAIIGSLAVFIGATAVTSLLLLAQPLVTLLVTLLLSSIAAGTFGLGYFWSIETNIPNFVTLLMGLTYSLTVTLTFCYHYINSHFQDNSKRLEYVFNSSLVSLLKSSALLLLCATPLLAVKTGLIQTELKILLILVLTTNLHVILFLPPCLQLLRLKLPKKCGSVSSSGGCGKLRCCSSDEDASSIYYITAKQPQMNPEFVQKFYQEKFREDILNSSTLQSASLPSAKPPPHPHLNLPDVQIKSSESPSLSCCTSEPTEIQPKTYRAEQHVEMEIPTRDKRPAQLSEIPEEPKPSEADVERKIYIPKKYRDYAKTVSQKSNKSDLGDLKFLAKPQTVSKRQGQDLSQLFRDQYRDALKSDTKPKAAENFYSTIPDTKLSTGSKSPREKNSVDTSSSAKKSSSGGSEQHSSTTPVNVNVIDVSDGDLTSSSDAKSTTASTTESVYIVVESGANGKKELRKVENAPRRSRNSFVEENHLGNKVSYASWNTQEAPEPHHYRHQVEPERIVFAVPMPPVYELRPEWSDTWLHGTVRQHNGYNPSRPTIFNMGVGPDVQPPQYYNRPHYNGPMPPDDHLNPELREKLNKQAGRRQQRSATVRIK